MKRTAIILGILSIAVLAPAQSTEAPQQAPAASQPASAQGAPAAQPAVKRPPQLKTKEEQDAYNASSGINDAAGLEKAADDFAAKFPDSEVRVLLYGKVMRSYQSANNA